MQLNNNPGPVSAAGKEISSRNALKHGACSVSTLILPTESLADFEALEARWFEGYKVNPNSPDTQYEAELIRTAARADWFLQRADRSYAEAEAMIFAAQPNVLLWDEQNHRTLARFLRYRTTHTNTVAKHRKAIEDYRKNRAQEAAQAQTMQHKDEKMAMTKQKNKPKPTIEETLVEMRETAIRLGYVTPDGKPTGKQ
jgi:hypothetical protein